MKIFRFCLFAVLAPMLLMITPAPAYPAPAGAGLTAAYNEAGALYRAGKFPESLARYEQVLKTGILNPICSTTRPTPPTG